MEILLIYTTKYDNRSGNKGSSKNQEISSLDSEGHKINDPQLLIWVERPYEGSIKPLIVVGS